jgi:hypothetical protein
MAETVFDCARVPEDNTCSEQIAGERDHVVQAAHDHMVSVHGMEPGDDLTGRVKRVVDEPPGPHKYGTWAN